MKDRGGSLLLWSLYLLFIFVKPLRAQVLTPPYFNLAENRRITATSTCGQDVADPELYCKLVGANADRETSSDDFIQGGQWCDVCDPYNPDKTHPPEYAIDGTERWWQSPPLSRGMDYNQVNLTIDLGQLFQVAYVLIKMGNSPRPGVWVLERSVDNGENFTPWQYFAGNDGECQQFFGKESIEPIREDDDVKCVTHFSKVVPLEGGEIVVSLLNNRPSANSFFNSSTLQEFTRATNVRLRLIQTKTLLGHLMSVARQDSTVTRRYFYSVKDISIGGRCVCNGHADVCDITDPDDLYKLQCRCQHNTCGSQCEMCCPGFIQKKWRPAGYHDSFNCEPCNCFGHSDECIYDAEVDKKGLSIDIYGLNEGGGVCQNCKHNTEGINCDKCKPGFYRPYDRYLNDTDVCHGCNCNFFYATGNCDEGTGRCQCKPEFLPPHCDACNDGYYDYPNCKPCDCHRQGTLGGRCQVGGGQCPCKENYIGLNCDECAPGHYNFPECLPCDCNDLGTYDNSTCDIITGQCLCENKFGGRTCDECAHGYFDYPECEFCDCDAQGTEEEICNKATGTCLCLLGFSGKRCDSNAAGFWGYPLIQLCGCHEKGSATTSCDSTGDCTCLDGFSGRACDQCSSGYYNFPDCIPCNCDQAGSVGISCDVNGRCQCRPNYSGTHCDKCYEGFYNFPLCEECNCNPAGVLHTFAGCGNAPVGELCECKGRVTGRICDSCRPLYWNLQHSNPQGCEECGCESAGTVGGMASCDSEDGHCFCKPGVQGRQCDVCTDGAYHLQENNIFGCKSCGCNLGGSADNVCDKNTGQCRCRPRITGRRCDQPLQLHYFPTLYQLKYEAEDGYTPQNTAVRFGYDEYVFPGYSWRGYAVFSEIQKEIIHEVYIEKPSLYRMVMMYHNPSSRNVVGKIKIIPDNPRDDEQVVDVHFRPTSRPELMTVVTVPGEFPVPLVMNPGRWSVHIQNDQNLFLDYFVLLPLAYYEGTILTENVTHPCLINQQLDVRCLHYAYPNIFQYSYIYGSAGYRDLGGERFAVDLFTDDSILQQLDTQPMAWLNHNQPKVQFDMRLPREGHYILLINYYTPEETSTTNVMVETSTMKGKENGRAILYDCRYSTTCRQAFTDMDGKVGVFNFDDNYINMILKGETNTNIAIESIVAVPYEHWNEDLIQFQPVCTRQNGECLTSFYPLPPDTVKVEFENNLAGNRASVLPWGVTNDTGLVYLNDSMSMVDITGKLRSAGHYVFIVHYYQPDYPEYEVDVLLQNGHFYEGALNVRHCPSTSGCRNYITQPDGNYVFDVLENFVLTLKEPNDKSLWVDYLLAVPAEHFSHEILDELPQDITAEFINSCGENHFNLQPNTSDFCRDAVFKLTTDYNSGALACQCDFHGSASFQCNSFGGQCQCKPNVIGRRCNRCKTGFFGFPDCRPCNCPSTALCDPVTGECICPPRVEGEQCGRCSLYTYGFDPIIGCEECQCSPLGVKAGNLQCDLQTGQCDCKDSVVGRRCERCAAGYWSFPFCQLCDCDYRGTEADICNQDDARCYCKHNVYGRACDTCTAGSYNLEESNPDGCTKCFCFGRTEHCSSSDMHWTLFQELDMSTFGVAVLEESLFYQGLTPQSERSLSYSSLITPPEYRSDLILQTLTEAEEDLVYFTLPSSYLGNKIKSYGGYLQYSLIFTPGNNGSELEGPDVILQGNNIIAQYYSLDHPTSTEVFTADIRMTEHNFRTLSGTLLQREQFMTLLHNIESILIRANYESYAIDASLFNVTLDVPIISDYSYWGREALGQPALSVEFCQCPVNYEGSSCESCADGYYRAQTGPYGGYCVRCQCNGHSDMCDKETGKCLNCRHNTAGDHCEECAVGYHGRATQGTPYDCLICACPLPSITNNFAKSCEVTSDGISIRCNCEEGYTGPRCEHCDAGYYGQPEVLGEKCKPCECNDNIDVNNRYACDDITGRCLACLNNTYGNSCERCAPGYYGDAIDFKNCESCTCNECGTRNCEHFSGNCECYNNVVGLDCDQCAENHWGFASCQGCQPCQCEMASVTEQCDEGTGQCECRPGVTGQRCDHCKPGFWDYTQNGCTKCTCQEGFSIGVGCDPRTGQCSCLPGVIGANCEGCPYRWVLIEGYGCRECEECVHALLDTTDELKELIDPTIFEFKTAQHSYFLHRLLTTINDTLPELRPKVDLLDLPGGGKLPIEDELTDVLKEALTVQTQSSILYDRANNASSSGFTVYNEALKVQEDADDSFDVAKGIVIEINKLVIGLEIGKGAQLDLAIHEAEDIVSSMKEKDFGTHKDNADEELEISTEFLEKMQNFYYPVNNQSESLDAYDEWLNEFDEKIYEMIEIIEKSGDKSDMTADLNIHIRERRLKNLNKKLDDAKKIHKDVLKHLDDAEDYKERAKANFLNASDSYVTLNNEVESLRASKRTLNESMITLMEDLEDAQFPSKRAESHAKNLQNRASELDDLAADTLAIAEQAKAAANAYTNIVTAIDDAYNASLLAQDSAYKAVSMSEGVSDQAVASHEKSEEKLTTAIEKVDAVEKDLRPQLEDAEEEVEGIRDLNWYIEETLGVTESQLTDLQSQSISEETTIMREKAVRSRDKADEAILKIENVEGQVQAADKDAKMLQRNVVEGQKAIELANRQVEKVEKDVPEMIRKAEFLSAKKETIQTKGIDIGNRLEKLRETIQKTRELANKIKVGVSFLPNTTIELQNPEDLTKAATKTKISLFVQTVAPSGLLLFMGTPVGGNTRMRRTKTDDFIAIEVEHGAVRLTMNLGAGAHSITYDDLYLADGVWTKIIVERTGKVVKLTIQRDDMEEKSIEKVLPGKYSVFNLDPKVTKMYVGGIPPGVFVDKAIRSASFDGQMEDIRLNDRPIGLWNFMHDGTNNNVGRGAIERDRLVDLIPPTGLRFDGNGYVATDTRNGYRFQKQFDLQLDFKSFAEDGIIFMIDSGNDQFISVALEQGHVVFKYDLGAGFVNMKSKNTYNDGQWHSVDVARQERNGVLKIEGEVIQGTAPGGSKTLSSIPDSMYFGGYPGEHNFNYITKDGFSGCIDNIVMSGISVDLSKSKESLGTVPGCPIQVANLVSFTRDAPGYVQYDSPDGSGLQLVLKFKTQHSNGVLFFTSTKTFDSSLTLSLKDSALILTASPGGELTTGSFGKYNDSEWHVVIATRDHNELTLDIDDFKSYKVDVAHQAVPFNGPVFFGGIPPELSFAAGPSAASSNFIGCIGDATLNGRIVNFAQSPNRPNALLQKCPITKSSLIFIPPSVDGENATTGYDDKPLIVHQKTPAPPIETTTKPHIVTLPPTLPPTTEVFRSVTEMIPAESCALPVTPAKETDPGTAEGYRYGGVNPPGYRFGSKRHSRIDFETLPENPRGNFKFSVDIKTEADEGIIFYGGSGDKNEAGHTDYLTFYLKDGQIVFCFNPGNDQVLMRTPNKVNDGEWHTVVVERREEYGLLSIDGSPIINATSNWDPAQISFNRYIDLKPPYYYGGLEPSAVDQVRKRTEGVEISFNGCLKNIYMNSLRLGGLHKAHGIHRCTKNYEKGVFFGEGIRSHAILMKGFHVGLVFDMSMDIKPRKNSGVIMSIHGRKDFLMLQLVNGTLEFSVNNGKGIITTRHTLPSPFSICDGQWHTVQVIKTKNLVFLIVNDVTTDPVRGPYGSNAADTNHPLFLGSQPRILQREGNAVAEKFVGCIRNIRLHSNGDDIPINMSYLTYVGNVNAGACPTI